MPASTDDQDLEQAKDIADQINNGKLGEDAGNDDVVRDYTQVIPPGKQPPSRDQYPCPAQADRSHPC